MTLYSEYVGRLAAFGDPVLDALVERGKAIKDAKRVRAPMEKPDLPARCPSCARVRVLIQGHKAVICQECHDDIARLAGGLTTQWK